LVRAVPFIWPMPDWYLPRNTPLIKTLGPIRASITRILALRYRMYSYTVRNPCHELICMTSSAT
jgi:hypothetical protein